MIAKISGFHGEIVFDKNKPDGVMQKLLDSSRIKRLGWKAIKNLESGIEEAYNWYQEISKR